MLTDQDMKTEGQVHPQAHPDLSQQNWLVQKLRLTRRRCDTRHFVVSHQVSTQCEARRRYWGARASPESELNSQHFKSSQSIWDSEWTQSTQHISMCVKKKLILQLMLHKQLNCFWLRSTAHTSHNIPFSRRTAVTWGQGYTVKNCLRLIVSEAPWNWLWIVWLFDLQWLKERPWSPGPSMT